MLTITPSEDSIDQSATERTHTGMLNSATEYHLHILRYANGSVRIGYTANNLTPLKQWLTQLYPDSYTIKRNVLPALTAGSDAKLTVGRTLEGASRRRRDWVQPLRPAPGTGEAGDCPVGSAPTVMRLLIATVMRAEGPMIVQIGITECDIALRREQRLEQLRADEDTFQQLFHGRHQPRDTSGSRQTEPQQETNRTRYRRLKYLADRDATDICLNWRLLATGTDDNVAKHATEAYQTIDTTNYKLRGRTADPNRLKEEITSQSIQTGGLRMHRLPDIFAFGKSLLPNVNSLAHRSPVIVASGRAIPHFTLLEGGEFPEIVHHGLRQPLPAVPSNGDDSR